MSTIYRFLSQIASPTDLRKFSDKELQEVVADDAHAPAFQRKRDRIWVWRAKLQLRKLPK